MKIVGALTNGINEVNMSKHYKSGNTRRKDLCNRYNMAISTVLQCEGLSHSGRALVVGAKGLITKTIVDSLDDAELSLYVETVNNILNHMFGDAEF
jgi:hypothetical protein